jgi:hypothetical protein
MTVILFILNIGTWIVKRKKASFYFYFIRFAGRFIIKRPCPADVFVNALNKEKSSLLYRENQ